jgi:hypothetical protein
MPPAERRARQAELLGDLGRATDALARALGPGHMLVSGARRYQRQLEAMAGGRSA